MTYKRIIFLFTFSILVFIKFDVKSQVIIDEVTYLYSYGERDVLGERYYFGYSKIQLGDTINDTIHFSSLGYQQRWNSVVPTSSEYFSIENKVFSKSANPQLLYDYSLSVGDTFVLRDYGSLNDTFYFEVTSIFDSTLTNGKEYEIFTLFDASKKSGLAWVKGIGSMNIRTPASLGGGAAWSLYGHYPLQSSEGLGAYTQLLCDQSEVHRDTRQLSWATCDTAVLNSIILSTPKKVSKLEVIFPNPCKNKLQIKSNEVFENYSITDILGKRVLSGNYSNSISTESLKPGIYFLELYNSEKRSVHKFTK